ncbi:MAG: ABC transporter ATP-binding protein [Lachnospiraceae bacterium]|nr:ABC transporter ATP-binding protein [Lachnospiraceae bacterium]
MAKIICENVHKSYGSGKNKVDAVRGISFTFEKGRFYSIIGKSGSGKSTFLHLAGGILMPDEGRILYDSVDLAGLSEDELSKTRREMTGTIFQDYLLLPELTVKENIIMPAVLDHRVIDEDWCNEILKRLQMEGLADRYPSELSGGEQQRTSIGRAIMNKPDFVFADEPTGNLDRKTGEAVLDFLLAIRDLYQPMILMVTHDLDIARSADLLLHIEDGVILDR